MARIVDSIDQLTGEWFTEALREGGVIADGTAVATAETALYGTGQLGLVARAVLEYSGAPTDEAPKSVIVKLPSADAGSRAVGVAIGAYEGEVRFYEEVLDLVEIDTPRPFWGKVEAATGRFTLVLEDLSGGWTCGDAVAGGTVEQAEAALDQLVRLQAPRWDDPDLRSREWLASPARVQTLFDFVEPALAAFVERFGPRLAPMHVALAEELGPKASTYPARAWGGPMVLVHGDYRLDNMLFAPGPTGLQAKVLDWQAVRMGPPLVDAAIYLGCCLPTEVRRRYQDALLRRYHDALVAAGVKDFTLADCLDGVRRGALYVFLIGIAMSANLQQTERGDQMFADMVAMGADLALDFESEGVLR